MQVDYEVLSCALTAPDAMREGAPIIHEDLKTKEFGESTSRVSNIAEHFRQSVTAGFGRIEQTAFFKPPMLVHNRHSVHYLPLLLLVRL